MGAHLILHILRALAALAENFPDNPRLGRNLLLGGGLLLCALFVPDTSPEWGDLILALKCLSAITGGVCLILGAFVFSALGMETAGKSPTHHHLIAAEISVRG